MKRYASTRPPIGCGLQSCVRAPLTNTMSQGCCFRLGFQGPPVDWLTLGLFQQVWLVRLDVPGLTQIVRSRSTVTVMPKSVVAEADFETLTSTCPPNIALRLSWASKPKSSNWAWTSTPAIELNW